MNATTKRMNMHYFVFTDFKIETSKIIFYFVVCCALKGIRKVIKGLTFNISSLGTKVNIQRRVGKS